MRWEKILSESDGRRALSVFDFDDTLAKSQSRVILLRANGEQIELTPAEYAVYVPRKGDRFDFSQFQKLIKPVEITEVTDLLREVVRRRGPEGAMVLTARGASRPVYQFLKMIGVPPIDVVALDSNNPHDKAAEIARRIDEGNLDYVEFFDDSPKNVKAVEELQLEYPDVTFRIHHITHAEKY